MQRFRIKFISSLLLACSVQATAAETLTFYTEHFPPYNFEHNGKIRGINADILQRACELAKLQCVMQSYPWLRAFELAQKDPQGGLFTIVKTPAREKLFHWIGPTASSKSYLYRLKRRTDIQLTRLEDAKKYAIAVAHGDIYEEYLLSKGFEHGKNLLQFRSKSAPVPLFLQGKVDLIIGSDIVIPAWLAAQQVSADVAVPALDISPSTNNYVALNLAIPEKTRTELQQAIDLLKESGEFNQIVQSYMVQK